MIGRPLPVEAPLRQEWRKRNKSVLYTLERMIGIVEFSTSTSFKAQLHASIASSIKTEMVVEGKP